MKSLLRRLLSPLGVDVFRYRRHHHYVPDHFGARADKYQDIRQSHPFGDIASRVLREGRTKLYYDRLFTIFHALRQITPGPSRREPLVCCEVGVYRGGTSRFMALVLEHFGHEYDLRLFDTFEGHDRRDLQPGVTRHEAGEFGSTSREAVADYLSDHAGVTVIAGRIQDTAAEVPGRVDFLHLDVDLYEPTLFGLDLFGPRVRTGGIIVLDDFGFVTCPGVMQAAAEFLETPEGSTFTAIPHLSGQCVLVKTFRTD